MSRSNQGQSKAAPIRQKAEKGTRTQKERSADTQRQLIESAVLLIQEFGFSRLTITDVARRAGLTNGAVQHHFRSRHDLIRGVVEALYPVLNVGIDHIAAAELPVPERMVRVIDVYWSIYGRSEYLVFWQLVFGTREHREFREYLHTLQKEIVAGAVRDLVRVFSDIAMQPRFAKQLFIFLTSELRGLALLSVFDDKQVLDANLVLLKQAATGLLKDHCGTAKSR